jgi:predicted Rossmann fold nucleotide-binding protein DprA/Smf involved in DNA uptake
MDDGDTYDLDEISERSGLDRTKLLSRLLELELAGSVRRVNGGRFIRFRPSTSLRTP